MRVRKMSVLALTAVAVTLSLSACDDSDTDKTVPSHSGPSTSATAPSSPSSPAEEQQGSGNGASGTAEQPDEKCTDQINYADDPRSNAEINSIGEETGHCPAVQRDDSASSPAEDQQGSDSGASGTAKQPDEKCTDQINYADDPRSNAEINSIGEETGYCPAVQH